MTNYIKNFEESPKGIVTNVTRNIVKKLRIRKEAFIERFEWKCRCYVLKKDAKKTWKEARGEKK